MANEKAAQAESPAAPFDTWWQSKLHHEYGVQWKHVAAARLLGQEHFPLVDLGAGNGVFLKVVEESFPGRSVHGVELSDVAIASKACASRIEQGDVMSWEPSSRVRTISLLDVIEHIPDPLPVLSRLARMSDYLLLACPNFNFLKARLDVLTGRIPFQNGVGRGGHVYWCQLDSLVKCFATAGLDVVATNHLYPKNEVPALRKVMGAWPAVFAHEFVFLLASRLRNTTEKT